MSFPLKVATLAAFILTAAASAMASDVSLAGSAAASYDTIPTTVRAPEAAASADNRAAADADVVFAPQTEVVQPLPSASIEKDGAGAPAPSLAALVARQDTSEALDEQSRCLAGAVYFESKGESLAGQLAVARVIINRADSGRFPDSLCGVVYQPGQFSFVRQGTMPQIRVDSGAWHQAVAIAQIALADGWDSVAEGALFFHARRVSPGWNRTRVALIDNHIFYR